ncbi:MAG: MFS transporter, partial [Cyclonatronaceae bacterium]
MKKGRLFTVFLVVLVDLIGFGIVLPLLPFYAGEFGANPVAIGLLYSVFSFAQLIFSPVWGSLSDRIGRRPVMLLSTFGAVIAYIIFGLAGSLAVLFLSRAVAGVMGGNIATAQAYIADVTTEKDRARGMGLIGAAFGIGFVMGPAIATGLIHPGFHDLMSSTGLVEFAEWMSANKFALPGFFAAGLSLLSFILVWFLLEETVETGSAKTIQQPSGPSLTEPVYKRYSVFSP